MLLPNTNLAQRGHKKLSTTVLLLLLSYPCSSPTQVRHLPQKMLRTGNIDTETNGTKTNNDLYNSNGKDYCEEVLKLSKNASDELG